MANLTFDVDANDQASSVFLANAAAAEEFSRQLDQLDGRKVKVKVKLDVPTSKLTATTTAIDGLDGRTAKVKVELDAPSVTEIAATTTAIDGLDGKTVKAKVELSGPSVASLNRITQLDTALSGIDGRVASASVTITGTPGAADVRQLRAAAKALRELDGLNATTSVQFTGNMPDAKQLRAAARALKQLQDISPVNVIINVSSVGGSILELLALARALRAVQGTTTAEVNVKTDKSGNLADLARDIAKFGAAAVAAAPSAINAGVAVVSLAGSLASVAGVAPVAAAAMLAGGAAAGALAVGFAHVGDALGPTGTPAQLKKVTEAMAALSPAARSTVQEIRGLGPAWTSLRLDVQEKLFTGLGSSVKQLGTAYLPSLRSGLGGIAGSFNGIAKDVTSFATSAGTVRDVDTIFRNTGAAVEAARPSVVNLASAFRDVAVVGSAELPQLAAGWTNVTAKFAAFIANARDTGQLKVWIDEGIQTLEQLGSVAGNVGSSLGAVFKAAKASGADFLTTLVDVTERVKVLLNSAQGQSALVAVFREAKAATNELLPGVESLARGVLDMLQSFANTGAVQNFARVVSDIAQTLAPLGATIGQIAGDALNGLANGAAVALGPLSALVGGVSGVASALGPLPGLAIAALVAFKALGAGTAVFATMSAAMTRTAQSLAFMSYNSTAFAGAAGVGSRAAAGLSTVLSKMGSALPIIGVALIGIGAAADAASVDFDGLTQKVANGSMTIAQAVTQAATDSQTGWAGFVNGFTEWSTGIDIAAASADKMRQKFDEYRASLGPMQQLQLDVTTSQSELNDAVLKFGSTSPEAAAAAAKLAAAQGQLDAAHKGAAEAAKTQAQREKELTDALQGQIGGMVAYEQAVLRTAEAHKKAADALKQSGKDSVEYKSAVLDLVSAIDSQAQAAQKQAESWGGADAGMKAYRLELLRAADTSTQAGRDAFVKLASSLDKTGTDALSATAKMSGLRTEIVTLPDGRQVTVVVAADRGKLPDVKQEVQDFVSQKYVGTVEVNGTSVGLHDEVIKAVTFANGQKGTVQLFADGTPALVTVGETKYRIDATTGTLQIQGNPAPGEANLSGLKLKVDQTTGVMTIDGNGDPAVTKIAGVTSTANTSIGTITIDGNATLAQGKTTSAVTFADGSKGTITIDGNQTPANGKVDATVTYGNGKTSVIKVDANAAAANSAIDNAARTRYATINVNTVYTSTDVRAAHGGAIGGIVHPMARGGVVQQAHGYATGGVRLTPMRGGIAQRVPANSWRVIGDRARGDEFYLPDDNAPRSMKIGAEWARRRGLSLVDMAGGGSTPVGQVDPRAAAVATMASRVANAAGPRGRGGTTVVQPPNLGPLLARIGSLEKTIESAVAAARPITVQAQPGSEVEAARAVRLTLR